MPKSQSQSKIKTSKVVNKVIHANFHQKNEAEISVSIMLKLFMVLLVFEY